MHVFLFFLFCSCRHLSTRATPLNHYPTWTQPSLCPLAAVTIWNLGKEMKRGSSLIFSARWNFFRSDFTFITFLRWIFCKQNSQFKPSNLILNHFKNPKIHKQTLKSQAVTAYSTYKLVIHNMFPLALRNHLAFVLLTGPATKQQHRQQLDIEFFCGVGQHQWQSREQPERKRCGDTEASNRKKGNN